jgi:hypothetical protein
MSSLDSKKQATVLHSRKQQLPDRRPFGPPNIVGLGGNSGQLSADNSATISLAVNTRA